MPTHYFFDAAFSFHSREIYPSEPVGADEVLVSAENPTVENFLGFGVAITGASCYLLNKMEKNAIKYPVDKSKGNATKYTEF